MDRASSSGSDSPTPTPASVHSQELEASHAASPPQAQILAKAKPRRKNMPCQKAMPRKRSIPAATDDLKRARRTSRAFGTSTTTLVPRFVPVVFADQQLLLPVDSKTPDGTPPSVFRVLQVFLSGCKGAIKVRFSICLDDKDKQNTVSAGDVLNGELILGTHNCQGID